MILLQVYVNSKFIAIHIQDQGKKLYLEASIRLLENLASNHRNLIITLLESKSVLMSIKNQSIWLSLILAKS